MKRGQIWVETAIYTLIAFILIGLVLAYAKPKIEESQDKAIIEQSISMMEDLNLLVLSLVQGGPGNKRLIEIGIKKGVLNIDGINDQVVFEMDSRYQFSQAGGDEIKYGSLKIRTEEFGDDYKVRLYLDYSNDYNITFRGIDQLEPIPKSTTPYNIFVSNKGKTKLEINEGCVTIDDCANNIEGYNDATGCDSGICTYYSKKTNILFEYDETA
jgi:hypothetical protein